MLALGHCFLRYRLAIAAVAVSVFDSADVYALTHVAMGFDAVLAYQKRTSVHILQVARPVIPSVRGVIYYLG